MTLRSLPEQASCGFFLQPPREEHHLRGARTFPTGAHLVLSRHRKQIEIASIQEPPACSGGDGIVWFGTRNFQQLPSTVVPVPSSARTVPLTQGMPPVSRPVSYRVPVAVPSRRRRGDWCSKLLASVLLSLVVFQCQFAAGRRGYCLLLVATPRRQRRLLSLLLPSTRTDLG